MVAGRCASCAEAGNAFALAFFFSRWVVCGGCSSDEEEEEVRVWEVALPDCDAVCEEQAEAEVDDGDR